MKKYPKEFEKYWKKSRYSLRPDFSCHKPAIYNGWKAGRRYERRVAEEEFSRIWKRWDDVAQLPT